MRVVTEQSPKIVTDPFRGRPDLGHRGNGDPNRPSRVKRREARALARAAAEKRAKMDEKNRKARERRAAAKAAANA